MSVLKQVSLVVVLFTVIGALASAADLKAFIKHLKKPKGILVGLICQYLLLPLIAFILCIIFKFDYESSIALILTATCPGGMISNFFSFAVGADLPLSIAMTTASSLLSFIFIPLNVFLYITLGLDAIADNDSSEVEIDWFGLLISSLALVFGIIVGLWISHKNIKIARRILGVFASLFLVLVLASALMDNLKSEYPLYSLKLNVYIATFLLTTAGWIFGLVLSLLICKMNKKSSVAIGIETSNQNTTVTITILTLTIINNDPLLNKVISIPAMYMFLTWIVNTIFIILFYKLGWIEQDDGNQSDQSMSLVQLIWEYKQSMRKSREDSQEDKIQAVALQEIEVL